MGRLGLSVVVAVTFSEFLSRCPGSPPSIQSFTATPGNLPPGSSSTLAWSVSGADRLTLDPGNLTVTGSSTSVSPGQTTVYTLTARNAVGATRSRVTVMVSTVAGLSVSCGPGLDPSVPAGGTIQVSAVFQVGSGAPSLEVDWAVDSSSLGSVSPARGPTTTYTAPAAPGRYEVRGTSVWDPTKKDSCAITVTPPPRTFAATGGMPYAATWHAAATLEDGHVLIAGGTPAGLPTTGAELYDPGSRSFSIAPPMNTERGFVRATLLLDGRVLMTGGTPRGSSIPDPAMAEQYDPSTGGFTTAATMAVNRNGHTATLLPDGSVLVAGGTSSQGPTAELYDPSSDTFSATGDMVAARTNHTATLLPSGLVLITGGSPELSSAELYDPASRSFSSAGDMQVARAGHTATMLPNGLVLIAGGSSTTSVAELYHPDTAQFIVTGATVENRKSHTATLLPGGQVLLAGCGTYDLPRDRYSPIAELYDPATGTFTSTGAMVQGRCHHAAALLNDATVLITGGQARDHEATLSTAEIYYP